MSFIFNINGRITPAEQARISVLDRGFLYGDSVYEVLRTYSGRPFALEQHLDRLKRSAERIGIALPDRATLIGQIERSLAASGNYESYCRIIVTRGTGPLTLDPTSAFDPSTVIIVKDYEAFPEWMYEKGIRLTITKIRRPSKQTLDPAIKSGNYLNSVLAIGEAKKNGFDDALLLNEKGYVTESTSSNIFALLSGDLLTPPLDHGLLAGITRSLIIELARDNQIPCFERRLAVTDLASADEIMLTSTLREVMPVVEIDGHRIGNGAPGPFFFSLRKLFGDHVQKTQGPYFMLKPGNDG
jgi:branched-chain amino acid aminotransferase